MAGPFNPFITPIVCRIHYLSRDNKWAVFVSRQIQVGGGAKYENVRNTFDSLDAAVTFMSTQWGNV